MSSERRKGIWARTDLPLPFLLGFRSRFPSGLFPRLPTLRLRITPGSAREACRGGHLPQATRPDRGHAGAGARSPLAMAALLEASSFLLQRRSTCSRCRRKVRSSPRGPTGVPRAAEAHCSLSSYPVCRLTGAFVTVGRQSLLWWCYCLHFYRLPFLSSGSLLTLFCLIGFMSGLLNVYNILLSVIK